MKKNNNNPLHKRQKEDKKLVGDFIVKQVEKTAPKSVKELRKEYFEEKFFFEAYSFDKGFIGTYQSVSEASKVFQIQRVLIFNALSTGESIDGLIFKYSSL